jgi:hypothetical protein
VQPFEDLGGQGVELAGPIQREGGDAAIDGFQEHRLGGVRDGIAGTVIHERNPALGDRACGNYGTGRPGPGGARLHAEREEANIRASRMILKAFRGPVGAIRNNKKGTLR